MKQCLLFLLLLFSSAINAQGYESEPNNTILQGTSSNTFNAPQTIGGYITASTNSDSVDFFKIILPDCKTWAFNILNPNGTSCTLKMYLYDSQNEANWIISSSGITFNFSTGIPSPVILNCQQEIYVKIDQTSGSNLGSYSLQITDITNSNEFVCNNSYNSVQFVPVDTVFNARLWGYDCAGNPDDDWYKVSPSRCGVLNVNITSIASDEDTSQVLKVSVTEENETDIVDEVRRACAGTGDVNGSFLLEGGKDYYVRISADILNFDGCTRPYVLANNPFVVTFDYDISDSLEFNNCNNTITDAPLIPLDTIFEAKLSGVNDIVSNGFSLDRSEDQDFYKVVPDRCGVLHVNISSISNDPVQYLKVSVTEANEVDLVWQVRRACAGTGDVDGDFLLEGGKEYYIRISGEIVNFDGCTRPYVLSDDSYTVALAFDISDSLELTNCNNIIQEAPEIPLDTIFEAKLRGLNQVVSDGFTLDRNEDQDFYKLLPTHCGTLNVNITGISTDPGQILKVTITEDNESNIIGTPVRRACNGTGDVNGSFLLEEDHVYYLRISGDIVNLGGCTAPYILADDSYTVTLSFEDLLSPPTISYSGDLNLCQNESITLSSDLLYGNHWNTGDTLNNITVNQQGWYTVSRDSANCSSDQDSVFISVIVLIANAGDDVTIIEGENTTIGGNPTATGNAPITYLWSPSDGLNNVTDSNPIASPNQNTTYTVTVTGQNECMATSQVSVNVEPVGIELINKSSDQISVSPNPCTLCEIKGTFDPKDIVITDFLGKKQQVVFIKSADGYIFQLAIDTRSGIYFVKNSKTNQAIKFIKE